MALGRRPPVRPVQYGGVVAGASRRRKLHNELQELVLLTGMTVTVGAVGWLAFGFLGLASVLMCVLVVGVLRPRVSVSWVLRVYDAQPLPRWTAPRLHWMVDVLAERAGLHRPPRLCYIASPIANAFVVGPRDDAALAVTDGLLRLLNGRELAGVLGHEISHLRNGDTSIMSLSDVVARVAQWMAWFGLWLSLLTLPLFLRTGNTQPMLLTAALVTVPTVVTLMQLALSRSREYDADLEAVTLTGDPESLAQALIALEYSEGRLWERIMVGRSSRPDPLLLQTHPRTEQRVRRLRALQIRPHKGLLCAPHAAAPSGYPPVTHAPRLRRPGVRW
jgi:heat shock protein HtpX